MTTEEKIKLAEVELALDRHECAYEYMNSDGFCSCGKTYDFQNQKFVWILTPAKRIVNEARKNSDYFK